MCTDCRDVGARSRAFEIDDDFAFFTGRRSCYIDNCGNVVS